MSFHLLLPEEFKSKTLRDLYPLIMKVNSTDWYSFHYGLALGDEKKSEVIASGIPANYGCVIFWSVGYDIKRMLNFAEDLIPPAKLDELKKDTENLMLEELELEEKDVKAIAEKHPEVVSYYEYELFLPVRAAPSVEEEDAESKVYAAEVLKGCLKKLRGLQTMYNRALKNKSGLAEDMELHLWKVPLVDSKLVSDALEYYVTESKKDEGGESSFDSVFEALSEAAEDAQEESEISSFVLILRASEDADTTVRQLEEEIGQEVLPLYNTYEPLSCFVNITA